MTDLQVKYQANAIELAKLNEEKRLHDAQIAQYAAQADKFRTETVKTQGDISKLSYEIQKLMGEINHLDADSQKLLAETGLTNQEIAWYAASKSADIYNKYASGTGNLMKGFGSLIPG